MLQHSFKKLLGEVAQRRAPGKGTAANGAWRARCLFPLPGFVDKRSRKFLTQSKKWHHKTVVCVCVYHTSALYLGTIKKTMYACDSQEEANLNVVKFLA